MLQIENTRGSTLAARYFKQAGSWLDKAAGRAASFMGVKKSPLLQAGNAAGEQHLGNKDAQIQSNLILSFKRANRQLCRYLRPFSQLWQQPGEPG